ncbi:MAG: hypothetical protein K6E52_10485 [Bacteroidaceae bacterium]|jgi:hypothetical protein|nr:hypothetical protein [Bacteroidaceae bacterium]
MFELILFSSIILAICVVFLCINIVMKGKGDFPNSHVSSNKAMRDRGIGCAQSQDRLARMENPHAISENEKD